MSLELLGTCFCFIVTSRSALPLEIPFSFDIEAFPASLSLSRRVLPAEMLISTLRCSPSTNPSPIRLGSSHGCICEKDLTSLPHEHLFPCLTNLLQVPRQRLFERSLFPHLSSSPWNQKDPNVALSETCSPKLPEDEEKVTVLIRKTSSSSI